jgi:hypothetical protein
MASNLAAGNATKDKCRLSDQNKSLFMPRILLPLLFVFLIAACNKQQAITEEDYVYISGTGLPGKWLATERWQSPGSGGSWYNLQPADKFTVEFLTDSSFSYSANFPMRDSLFNQYSLNGARIRMTSTVGPAAANWYYEIDPDGRLQLSIVLCIEGCQYGLRRIQ